MTDDTHRADTLGHETALNRSQQAEEAENAGTNLSDNPTIGDIIAVRFNRRDLMKGILGVGAITATVSPLALATAQAAGANTTPSFAFNELSSAPTDRAEVAEG